MAFPFAALLPVAAKFIDKFIPDPEAREAAKLEMLRAQQAGELEEMQTSLSAIMAEASSADPWTSRARPTFLYLIYLVILLCVVGGIISIWWPDHIATAARNISNLLGAIPENLWWLFGAGYLGYTGARSFDKWRGTTK